MAQMTLNELNRVLGREIPDALFVIAKSTVLGMDSAMIASTMQIDLVEIEELIASDDFRDVRLLLGAERQKELMEIDAGWDGIESLTTARLYKAVKNESDPKVLAQVAMIANRAERRSAPKGESPLNANGSAQRVPLTLTKRYTEKIAAGQVIERTEEQSVSILSGRMINPTFEEVQKRLSAQR